MSNLQDIERYFNVRLQKHSKSIKMNGPLILCHLDLADRNVIYGNDGSVCILDWSSAGFYPQSLEIAALHLNDFNGDQLVIQIIHALRQQRCRIGKSPCGSSY